MLTQCTRRQAVQLDTDMPGTRPRTQIQGPLIKRREANSFYSAIKYMNGSLLPYALTCDIQCQHIRRVQTGKPYSLSSRLTKAVSGRVILWDSFRGSDGMYSKSLQHTASCSKELQPQQQPNLNSKQPYQSGCHRSKIKLKRRGYKVSNMQQNKEPVCWHPHNPAPPTNPKSLSYGC